MNSGMSWQATAAFRRLSFQAELANLHVCKGQNWVKTWYMVYGHPSHNGSLWKVCKSLIADHPPTWVYNVTMADVEKKLLPCGSWQPEFPAEQAGRLAGWQALQDHSSSLLDSGIQLAIQISRHSLNSTPGCRLEAIGIFERNGTAIDWSWLVTVKLLFLSVSAPCRPSDLQSLSTPKTWTSGPWPLHGFNIFCVFAAELKAHLRFGRGPSQHTQRRTFGLSWHRGCPGLHQRDNSKVQEPNRTRGTEP